MRKSLPLVLFISCIISHTTVRAHDNEHFYRANNFFGEPRLEKKLLTFMDFTFAKGSSCESRNVCRDSAPLFDLYGKHNMRLLGKGVPGQKMTKETDLALANLSLLPAQGDFGLLSFSGKFDLFEAYATITQNFARGFFFQFDIPYRRIEVSKVCFKDLSKGNECSGPAPCYNENTPEWKEFLRLFDDILKQHHLCRNGYTKKGIGDTAVMLGWTNNFQDTSVLDYVDTTFKSGVIIPSAHARHEDNIFDIPLGYNDHLGFPVSADFAFGAYEWLSIGWHIKALPFRSKKKTVRMKTDPNQSGMIKLAQGRAKVQKGPLWTVGTFFKIDHAGNFLSFLFGYSFTHKNNDQLKPEDCCVFVPSIVNSDETLKGWKMHTVHFMLEIDFTKEESRLGPRVGFFYNRIITGKRVFKTNMIGGSFGLDIAWDL